MNSQAQPPRDKRGKGRRWPRITLGMVVVGLVAFIAWNGIQLAQVVGDMGAIGDFVLPVDEGQVVASSIAATTQPPPMTEPAPTTTSTSTTTTTIIFVFGGLGPPCMPSSCDLDVVASVDRADYIHNEKRGVLGWLLDWTQPSTPATGDGGEAITIPASDGSVIAGVLVDIERRQVEASVPVYEIPPTEYEIWVATFYFGDLPTTLEPITADILLGFVDDEYSRAVTGWTCNNVEQNRVAVGGCGGAGRYGAATMDDWLAVLAIGRAYHLQLTTSWDQEALEVYFASSSTARERCEDFFVCPFQWATFDGLEYAERLVSLIKGSASDPPLPPDGFAEALMFMFPPLVDVAGPAVVIAVEPDCDECSGVVTMFESASRGMPVVVLELNEQEAQRLNIEAFPTVLIVDELGQSGYSTPIDEYTPEAVESLINSACVRLQCICGS